MYIAFHKTHRSWCLTADRTVLSLLWKLTESKLTVALGNCTVTLLYYFRICCQTVKVLVAFTRECPVVSAWQSSEDILN